MVLVTATGVMVIMIREERIPILQYASDAYFEEVCERVGQGIKVKIVIPDDYYPEWD